MKHRGLVLPLILVLVVGSLLPVVLVNGSVSWTSPGAVQQDYPNLDLLPNALQAANGSVWLAWQTNLYRGDALFDIAYKTGTLGTTGVSWSAPVRFTNNVGENSDPALAQLQNGTILLFWAYKTAANTNLYYARYTGGVWSNSVQVTFTSLNDTLPSAAVGRNGTLWLLWTRDNSTCGTCAVTKQLFYKTLSSGVWSNEQPLTSDANWHFGSSVLVGKDGIVRVAYDNGTSALHDFHIFYKTLNGTIWSRARQIVTNSTTGQEDIQPSIIQDRNGTLWLFWAKLIIISSTVQYYLVFSEYSIDNGVTWPSATVAQLTQPSSDQTQDSWQPSAIQSTNDKKLWLFYSTNRPGFSYEIWSLTSTSPISPVCDVGVASFNPVYSPSNSLQYPGGNKGIGQSPILSINVTLVNRGDQAEIVSVNLRISNTTIYNLSGSAYVNAGGGFYNVLLKWNTTGVKAARYGFKATVGIVTPACTINPGNQGDTTLSATNAVHLIPWGDIDQNGAVTLTDVSVFFYGFDYGPSCNCSQYNPLANIVGDPNGIDITDVSIAVADYDTFT